MKNFKLFSGILFLAGVCVFTMAQSRGPVEIRRGGGDSYVATNGATLNGNNVFTGTNTFPAPLAASYLTASGSGVAIDVTTGSIRAAGVVRANFLNTYDNGATIIANPGSYVQIYDGSGGDAIRISSSGNVGVGTTTASSKLHVVGDVRIATGSLVVPAGANSRAGNVNLVGGTVDVAVNTVTANSLVILTRKTSGGTPGTAVTYTLDPGVGFTVTSDNVLDTSTFSYFVIENP